MVLKIVLRPELCSFSCVAYRLSVYVREYVKYRFSGLLQEGKPCHIFKQDELLKTCKSTSVISPYTGVFVYSVQSFVGTSENH